MTDYTINGTADIGTPNDSNNIFSNSGLEQDAIEFWVTQSCWATAIRFYRGTNAIAGTVHGRIWVVTTSTTGSLLAGTDVTFAALTSGSGAIGWQSASTASPVLLTPLQRYRVAIQWATNRFASWNMTNGANYWTLGPGASGIVNGPLVVPKASDGTGGWTAWGVTGASWTYPNIALDYNYSCDVTVTDADPSGRLQSSFLPYML